MYIKSLKNILNQIFKGVPIQSRPSENDFLVLFIPKVPKSQML